MSSQALRWDCDIIDVHHCSQAAAGKESGAAFPRGVGGALSTIPRPDRRPGGHQPVATQPDVNGAVRSSEAERAVRQTAGPSEPEAEDTARQEAEG